MATETDKERLRLFLGLKEKPEMALFQLAQQIKKQVAEETAAFMSQMEERIKKMVQDGVTEEMRESIFRGVKKIKGDSGEKGEKGDSIKGDVGKEGKQGKEGRVGPQGPKPMAGVDYPIPKDGKDGYTPIKGKDYFDGEKGDSGSPDTPKQVRDKLIQLKGEERLPASAIKDLEDLKKITERIALLGGDRGRRVWSKNHITPSGSVNGTNTTFTLPSQAILDSEKVFVNTQLQIKGSSGHYTMSSSNTQIVFNSGYIPQTGDTIVIFYEEDR